MFETTRVFCDSFLNMGVPGFDLRVYKDGACILNYRNGYSDLERKVPVEGNERYRLYSCSKPITCTAAMQLWERGLFKLDDPVSAYLPEYANMTVQEDDGTIRPAKTTMLVRHLFQMSGGFSYNYNSPKLVQLREETDGMCTTRQVIRALAGEPLLFDPGTRYKYSLCHDVLAALVEVVSGQQFETYVKDHIFDPLGMTHSTFYLPEEEADSLTCQYRFNYETGTPDLIPKTNWRVGKRFVSGGGGCVSTVDDYIKFGLAMCSGETLLKRETIRMMMKDGLNDEQKKYYPGTETSYGLGIRVPREGSWRTEFGWGGAAGAFISIDPTHQLVIFYAQQMLNSPNQKIRSNLYPIIMEELGLHSGAQFSESEDPGSVKSVT